MRRTELSLILGGPQGSGLETAMWILTLSLARAGYGVIADREYYSNIVGRHSYIHMRVSSARRPRSLKLPVEVLVASDAETLFTHFNDIGDGGYLIYDTSIKAKQLSDVPSVEDVTRKRIMSQLSSLGVRGDTDSLISYLASSRSVLPIPIDSVKIFRALSERFKLNAKQASRFSSSILGSALTVVMGLDPEDLEYAVRRRFGARKDLLEQNMFVAQLVGEMVKDYRGIVKLEDPSMNAERIMVVTGNETVAMGKIIGGVRFQSYYPITPAADESIMLEKYEVLDSGKGPVGPILVLQAEDEIAAIASVIGASLTGARSSTATSGPGFDLMIEGIGWAGNNETPVVITYYQRGGPSTGLPTRGGQSDLFNALFSGHGEFARVVLASGDHKEALYDAAEAFNIAEKYQVPVIHLLDKFLANSIVTETLPDFSLVKLERGVRGAEGPGYKRFDLSSTISPRLPLGAKDTVMWYTGDEHDELGHISEDPENRARMYSKRIEKLKLINMEIPSSFKLTVHGHESPDYALVGWGFVKGVAIEAIEQLSSRGLRGMYVNLRLMWPFPTEEFTRLVRGLDPDKIIAVEHSYGVSIADLIAMNTGVRVGKKIAKYTGRPIYLNELTEAVQSLLSGRTERAEVSLGA
ncbi:MAG: 2-oxoacid:ferredoxin oxidoreductase subunit alpha [Thermosphaera sp.]